MSDTATPEGDDYVPIPRTPRGPFVRCMTVLLRRMGFMVISHEEWAEFEHRCDQRHVETIARIQQIQTASLIPVTPPVYDPHCRMQ